MHFNVIYSNGPIISEDTIDVGRNPRNLMLGYEFPPILDVNLQCKFTSGL